MEYIWYVCDGEFNLVLVFFEFLIVDESVVLYKCVKVIQKLGVYIDMEIVYVLFVKYLVVIIVS